MKRKLIAIMLISILCVMTACALVDDNDTKEPIYESSLLVGFTYNYETTTSQGETEYLLNGKLEDDSKAGIYYRQYMSNNHKVGEFFGNQEYLHNTVLSTLFTGESIISKLSIDTTIHFTYELLGKQFVIDSIYKDNKTQEYFNDNTKGAFLNDSDTFIFKDKQAVNGYMVKDSIKETKTFDSQYSIQNKFIDYLINAKIIEFDKNDNVIATNTIDYSQYKLTDYIISQDCQYIIIEEEYQVMHDSDKYIYPKGTKYSSRTTIDKNDKLDFFNFKVPNGNGLVNIKKLSIKF